MRLVELLFLYLYYTEGRKWWVSKFWNHNDFYEGPKCLLKGAKVSPATDRSVLTRNRTVFFSKGPKYPKEAEVVGTEVVGTEVVGAEVLTKC